MHRVNRIGYRTGKPGFHQGVFGKGTMVLNSARMLVRTKGFLSGKTGCTIATGPVQPWKPHACPDRKGTACVRAHFSYSSNALMAENQWIEVFRQIFVAIAQMKI